MTTVQQLTPACTNCPTPQRDKEQEHPGVCVCGGYIMDVVLPSGWRPIATAPRDDKALFWLVAKPSEECPVDTSGRPIEAHGFTPTQALCCYGAWPSLLKATHWQPLPAGPEGETNG